MSQDPAYDRHAAEGAWLVGIALGLAVAALAVAAVMVLAVTV